VEITYAVNRPITATEFVDLLRRSTLGQRRPIDDVACMQGMLDHANLLVMAHAGELLIGVARSVTDFHFCCYLSDLAVDEAWQRKGIGQELIRFTQQQLGPRCTLILLSAPAAVDYYPHIGFEHHPQAWVLKPGATLGPR
jgi:GNAT superfamily N-acetyltransferase